jgi:hypothetical protein
MTGRSFQYALFVGAVLLLSSALGRGVAHGARLTSTPQSLFPSSVSSDVLPAANLECPATAPMLLPYVVPAGARPPRCALLAVLAAGEPVVFAGLDTARAQALLALAEGQPASEAIVPSDPPDPAPLHYVIVQRSPTGAPLMLESIGVPLTEALSQASRDAERPPGVGRIGDAWFQVLRSELVVRSYTAKVSKTYEEKYFCIFCWPPGNQIIRCHNTVERATRDITYFHNVYRLISAYVPDDFYLADAWAVRPTPTDYGAHRLTTPRFDSIVGWHCSTQRGFNMGLVNQQLTMEQPLAVDARTNGTVGDLYEWAPERTPQKHEYRLYLGTDARFGKKGYPLPGLNASYEITWTVEEFSVNPRINGFVATDGHFNTEYWNTPVDPSPIFYPPARDPFQATSSFEQGFTTKIPAPKPPDIYQHLYFAYSGKLDQIAGIGCPVPVPPFRANFSNCHTAGRSALAVSSRPLVTDPVLGFQAAPNEPYKYRLEDVCVVQRDHGVNPTTTLRLISQQFSPAQPIPAVFANSGGGHIDPNFVAIEPIRDEKTFAIHVRLNAGKAAHLDDRRTFDVETKPQHISPSTRLNPVRFSVIIKAQCP